MVSPAIVEFEKSKKPSVEFDSWSVLFEKGTNEIVELENIGKRVEFDEFSLHPPVVLHAPAVAGITNTKKTKDAQTTVGKPLQTRTARPEFSKFPLT